VSSRPPSPVALELASPPSALWDSTPFDGVESPKISIQPVPSSVWLGPQSSPTISERRRPPAKPIARSALSRKAAQAVASRRGALSHACGDDASRASQASVSGRASHRPLASPAPDPPRALPYFPVEEWDD
jgi:hypothetical protein